MRCFSPCGFCYVEIKNTGIKSLIAVLVALPFVFFIVHMLEMVDDPGSQTLDPEPPVLVGVGI